MQNIHINEVLCNLRERKGGGEASEFDTDINMLSYGNTMLLFDTNIMTIHVNSLQLIQHKITLLFSDLTDPDRSMGLFCNCRNFISETRENTHCNKQALREIHLVLQPFLTL